MVGAIPVRNFAKCKGCNKFIKLKEDRLRHKINSKKQGPDQVSEFHMKTGCLRKQPEEHLQSLFEKKWTAPAVVVFLDDFEDTTSDTNSE